MGSFRGDWSDYSPYSMQNIDHETTHNSIVSKHVPLFVESCSNSILLARFKCLVMSNVCNFEARHA